MDTYSEKSTDELLRFIEEYMNDQYNEFGLDEAIKEYNLIDAELIFQGVTKRLKPIL